MERKEAIERLKQLRLDYTEFWEEIKNETTEALDMAIASLETDEAYNLMYEQPEFCKADNSVLEDIKAEIRQEYDREAQNHDSFDEYSEGRYDAFGFCLRTLDKHISGKE